MRLLRLGVAIGCALSLGSCSFVYRLEARFVGRALIFSYKREGLFRRHDVCINSIQVVSHFPDTDLPRDLREGPPGTPTAWEMVGSDECLASREIAYGSRYDGADVRVQPHALKVGVIYTVDTSGLGTEGTGRFALTGPTSVENLPL